MNNAQVLVVLSSEFAGFKVICKSFEPRDLCRSPIGMKHYCECWQITKGAVTFDNQKPEETSMRSI